MGKRFCSTFNVSRKADELELGEDNKDGIGEFAFKDSDTTKLSEFQKYMRENYYDVSEDLYAGRALNWDADLTGKQTTMLIKTMLRLWTHYIYHLNIGIMVK